MAFKWFGGTKRSFAAGAWPQAKIVEILSGRYETVEHLGEDDNIALYGVMDHGVTFVVGMAKAPGQAGGVTELGFFARFVGFGPSGATIETINRNLHIAVASLEEDGDLFLLAGIEAAGAFDEGTFTLVLEAWRRDITIVLHALSGQGSMAEAFAFAGRIDAKIFATNRAPESASGERVDILKAFLGARSAKALCHDCGGRGRRGLIARTCEACGGAGLVAERRSGR